MSPTALLYVNQFFCQEETAGDIVSGGLNTQVNDPSYNAEW